MSELKTLKEIFIVKDKFGASQYLPYNEYTLRQEAIKWVKHYNRLRENMNMQDWDATIFWIKKFFNLTEADLK